MANFILYELFREVETSSKWELFQIPKNWSKLQINKSKKALLRIESLYVYEDYILYKVLLAYISLERKNQRMCRLFRVGKTPPPNPSSRRKAWGKYFRWC